MPATDNQGSFLNLISIRRNQAFSVDASHDVELEDLELFNKHVADRFSDLLPPPSSSASDSSSADLPPPEPLLSIAWFRKLLDTFLCCEAEFKVVLMMGRDPSQLSKPPLDRLIPEFLERIVKALDICNAVSDGIELLLHWQKLAQIAVSALEKHPVGEGQIKRANKALCVLLASMAHDEKDGSHSKSTERNWSSGLRGGGAATNNHDHKIWATENFGWLLFPISKSWSAAKQIHAMSANLTAPRGGEHTSLVSPVYAMSAILVFVMWAMVAAIPCVERNGLSTHLVIPKQLNFAQSLMGLQEKIGEEWKKKEKKGTAGLLEEVHRMEKVAQNLVEFSESFQFQVEEEKWEEVEVQVAEMAEISCKMEEGLVPLEQQLREVYHRIMRSRGEVLDVLDQVGKVSATVPY